MEYLVELLIGGAIVQKFIYQDRTEALTFFETLNNKYTGSNTKTVRYREVKRNDLSKQT